MKHDFSINAEQFVWDKCRRDDKGYEHDQLRCKLIKTLVTHAFLVLTQKQETESFKLWKPKIEKALR